MKTARVFTAALLLLGISTCSPQRSYASTLPIIDKTCAATSGTANVTVSCSGIPLGDVVLVFAGSAATTQTFTTMPSGTWTQPSCSPMTKTTNSNYIFTHTAVSGDGPNYSFVGGTSASMAVVMIALRYANTAAPIDGCVVGTFANSATSVTSPSIATSVVNDLIVGVYGNINSQQATVGQGHNNSVNSACTEQAHNASGYRNFVETCGGATGTGATTTDITYGTGPASGGVDATVLIAPQSATVTYYTPTNTGVGGPIVTGSATVPTPPPTDPYPASASPVVGIYNYMGSLTNGGGNNYCPGSTNNMCLQPTDVQSIAKYVEGGAGFTGGIATVCGSTFLSGGCLGFLYNDSMDVACGSGQAGQGFVTALRAMGNEADYTHTSSTHTVATEMVDTLNTYINSNCDDPTLATARNDPRTTSTTPVSGAGTFTITPASMAGVSVGDKYRVMNSNGTNSEIITVSSVSGSTFTATFTSAKSGTWNIQTRYTIYPNYSMPDVASAWATAFFNNSGFLNGSTNLGARWDNMSPGIRPKTQGSIASNELPFPTTTPAIPGQLATNRIWQATLINGNPTFYQAANMIAGSGNIPSNDSTGSSAMVHNYQENVDDFCGTLTQRNVPVVWGEKIYVYGSGTSEINASYKNAPVTANTLSDFYANSACNGIDVAGDAFQSNHNITMVSFRTLDKAMQMILQDPSYNGQKSDRQYLSFRFPPDTSSNNEQSITAEDGLNFVPSPNQNFRPWNATGATNGKGCGGGTGGVVDLTIQSTCSLGHTDYDGTTVGLWRRNGQCYEWGVKENGRCTAFFNPSQTAFTILDSYCESGCSNMHHMLVPNGDTLQYIGDNAANLHIKGTSTATVFNGSLAASIVAWSISDSSVNFVGAGPSVSSGDWTDDSFAKRPALILLP